MMEDGAQKHTVPVLHATIQDIPLGTIGDASLELPGVVHGAVLVAVRAGEVLEHAVIGACRVRPAPVSRW